MKLKPTERRKLREHLENRFSLEELKTLAFDLGVPYESLPHQTTQVLGRELIAYSERTNSLRDLIKQALQRRPDHSLRHIAARLVAELHTKIRIETVSVMPRIASPDQTITVVYELHSDLATPEEVWLGASLIDAKGKENYNAEQDKTISRQGEAPPLGAGLALGVQGGGSIPRPRVG